MTGNVARGLRAFCAMSLLSTTILAVRSPAQQPVGTPPTPLDLPVGRSFPIRSDVNVTRVSIANPAVADIVVISENEVVINSLSSGETDAIIWFANATRTHYRIQVHSPSDRKQIAIAVKFAEVRRNDLLQLGVNGFWRDQRTRVGTGLFNSDVPFDAQGGINIPGTSQFVTLLSDLGTNNFLAFLQAEEQKGKAHILAEPNILAGNKDTATFLSGGELPIPIVQGVAAGSSGGITIQYREFGIRLKFTGEIISDSLIKLTVIPEVSSLDFTNAITLQGFRVPALRSRRVSSTVDVKRDQSLIISGMFDDEDDFVKTGVPLLKDIPLLGRLFSSSRLQHDQTELLVVVTPVIVDPMHPRAQDLLRFLPDTSRPGLDALKKRLPPPVKKP